MGAESKRKLEEELEEDLEEELEEDFLHNDQKAVEEAILHIER
ncbi:hypothetical protein [Algoriphagus sp.]